MFGLLDYRKYMVDGVFSLTLSILGCGGSGPGPLPMRPDAGAEDVDFYHKRLEVMKRLHEHLTLLITPGAL